MSLDSYALWTATVTPFHQDGSLDLDSLKLLLKRQEAVGNGVVLLGSTGEALALSLEEQKSVIQFATGLKLTIPLLAGVGGFQLEQVIRWLEFCATQDIQGYLMPTPLYAKPGPVGQREWFSALLEQARRPCMLYNVPARTGQELLLEAIQPLASHPQFWALKEASGSVEKFHRYHQNLPPIKMFSGDDAMTYDCVGVGCSGLVSVASNIWPQSLKRYVAGSLQQSWPLAQRESFHHACESLFMASNPIPTKALLHHQGVIATPRLRPPLTHRELDSLEPLLEADRVMQEWQ